MHRGVQQLTETWPSLALAPIVEGMIDLRVERSPEATIEAMKVACDELAGSFPSRRERRSLTAQLTLSLESPSAAAQFGEPDGLMLRSADEKDVVQFRLDGFTYSRLRPYTSWEDLKAKAESLWAKYRDVARPQKITRVGVRFINRIPVTPGETLDHTFTTTFTVASSLPQAVAGFLVRIAIPFEQEQAMAIINQTMDADGTHCIFDIDAFEERAEGFTEAEAWDKLVMLRNVKNRVFFGSLTQPAWENFK